MPTGKIENPHKVYLDEPVIIDGIKINHTKYGLEYLIDHYTSTMGNNYLTDENIQHRQRLIENWKIHLELYNKRDL